jgi:protein lysine acetyltransferase
MSGIDHPPKPVLAGPVEGPATLRDGQVVSVRRVAPEDRSLLERFLAGLSESTLSRRYFAAVRPEGVLDGIYRNIQNPDNLSLLMTVGEGKARTVIAQAEYYRDGATAAGAEAAFLVADAFQGHGCATILLERLAREAVPKGITRFHAVVMSENYQMVEVFRLCGFREEERWGTDALHITLHLTETVESFGPPATVL